MKKFDRVYIEITNVCNLNCSFCPKSKREKMFMNFEDFEKIIANIKDYTSLVCLHVKGEPLLHPDLKYILNILEKYNLQTNITTNATLLSENINILKNSNSVRQINLSIHSINQNSNMDIEKYLKEVFYSVKVLNEETNIIVSYRFWNLDNLYNNEKNQYILTKFKNEYKIDNLINKLKMNEYLKLKPRIYINQDLQFEWPDLNKDIINENGRCLGLKKQIAILVNGDVVPCCLDNDGDINLGNIYKSSIEEILNFERCKNIIEGFEKGELREQLCKRCGFIKKLENKRK